jgi:hypothetical protein
MAAGVAAAAIEGYLARASKLDLPRRFSRAAIASNAINLALSMPSQHARRSQPRGSAMNLLPDAKASSPILAAGGIVLGEGSRPRIAIVRLRRDKSWVLPKGKLSR